MKDVVGKENYICTYVVGQIVNLQGFSVVQIEIDSFRFKMSSHLMNAIKNFKAAINYSVFVFFSWSSTPGTVATNAVHCSWNRKLGDEESKVTCKRCPHYVDKIQFNCWLWQAHNYSSTMIDITDIKSSSLTATPNIECRRRGEADVNRIVIPCLRNSPAWTSVANKGEFASSFVQTFGVRCRVCANVSSSVLAVASNMGYKCGGESNTSRIYRIIKNVRRRKKLRIRLPSIAGIPFCCLIYI